MFNIIVSAIGGIVLVLGLGSKWLEKSPLPPSLLALLTGILLGPEALDLVDPSLLGERSTIAERVARLTLGIEQTGPAKDVDFLGIWARYLF